MMMELQQNHKSDEYLVTACRSGDRSAYAELIRRHARRVYAVCLGVLGNISDSEDISQETFLKAMKHLHSLREGNTFGAWIAQIARNLCKDFIRSRSRRDELLARRMAENGPHPDEYHDLYHALEKLPEKHRTPLMLFYFDGKDTGKLAQELNLSQAGACTRLSRARKELRKLLGSQEGSK